MLEQVVKCRFVGCYTAMMGRPGDLSYEFNRFGQLVEVPISVAIKVQLLKPADTFDAIGFDPDDLKKYWNCATHHLASQGFRDKKKLAMLLTGFLEPEQVPVEIPIVAPVGHEEEEINNYNA
jgi:hypothetical protein